MKTSEVMADVTKAQAVVFVQHINREWGKDKLIKAGMFHMMIANALVEATGKFVQVNGTLAQGLCTAMEKRARLRID